MAALFPLSSWPKARGGGGGMLRALDSYDNHERYRRKETVHFFLRVVFLVQPCLIHGPAGYSSMLLNKVPTAGCPSHIQTVSPAKAGHRDGTPRPICLDGDSVLVSGKRAEVSGDEGAHVNWWSPELMAQLISLVFQGCFCGCFVSGLLRRGKVWVLTGRFFWKAHIKSSIYPPLPG